MTDFVKPDTFAGQPLTETEMSAAIRFAGWMHSNESDDTESLPPHVKRFA